MRDAARWAITDPHPWVRRESLKLFRDPDAATAALGVETDVTRFPGYADLVLEAHSHGADISDAVLGMVASERAVITGTLVNETADRAEARGGDLPR